MLLVTCTFSFNAIRTVLLIAMMFRRSSWCIENMTISHSKCHVARFIDDLLSFSSRTKVFYTQNRSGDRCCCFLLLLWLFFKTVVPLLQKTRTDIHDTGKTTGMLFYLMIKYPSSRYNYYYDTFTCSWF